MKNEFAAACYDMNSIEELEAALINPDKADMREWGLTKSEYKEQIIIAIEELKSDA